MAMTWGKGSTRSWLRLEQCIEIFFTEIPASVGGIPQVPSPPDAKERSSCSVLSCPVLLAHLIAASESKSFAG